MRTWVVIALVLVGSVGWSLLMDQILPRSSVWNWMLSLGGAMALGWYSGRVLMWAKP